jgi:hypothetical protein
MKMMKTMRVVCCVLLMVSGVAGAIGIPLNGDPIANLSGTQYVNENGLSMLVDYAVYDAQAWVTRGGADPDPWVQDPYIYAYQIFNISNSTVNVKIFSVGIAQEVTCGDIGVGTYDGITRTQYGPLYGPFGVQTSEQKFSDGSATWQFDNRPIEPGMHSVVLLFTSKFGPGNSSSGGGEVTISGDNEGISISGIATPVPEPLTLALLGIGGAALLRRRSH